jgi:hypothetical protein
MIEESENQGKGNFCCRKQKDLHSSQPVKMEHYIINLPISMEKPPGEFMETLKVFAVRDN